MNLKKECYEVGALLYAPALNPTVAASIAKERFGNRYSVALCLEDAIADHAVADAERQLKKTLKELQESRREEKFYLPKLFVRVREPEQLRRLAGELAEVREILTGFIFPKYSLENAEAYHVCMEQLNQGSLKKYCMMPILESRDIIDYRSRHRILLEIKEMMDPVREMVLNVRVGGNDFCNEFAARRHCNETIYDMLPVANLLGDILTVFSRDYVVSGPVWEFFSGDGQEWKKGLERELKLDRLNGFVGKTVIHPNQIPVVNDALKVSWKDYEDAKAILEWKGKGGLSVSRSMDGGRMNEVKTHGNWAMKTLLLAEIYGVKDEER